MSQHPVSLRDNVAPESVAARSVREAVVPFTLWADYERSNLIHLKHPNKEGLTTVVNDERSSRVALARVSYYTVHHRGGVKPQTANLCK